jgi:putative ABC transport system substrate-binding protein
LRPVVLLFTLPFLAALGWAGPSWGQTKIARVGVLAFAGANDVAGPSDEPLRRTLADYGWIEGTNISLEFRRPSGDPPQFTDAAADLIRLKVDILCAASATATRAAYAATRTVPIVALDFTNDPLAAGYVDSYGRPGRNVTGIFLDAPGFAAKWLELLKAMIPRLSRIAVLWDPSPGATHLDALQAVAPSLGVKLQVLEVRRPDDLDKAFASLRGRPQALIILPSPMTWGQSKRLAELAMNQRLPATSMAREFAQSGGALTYGPDLSSALERLAVLVAKVLDGAKPGDLPVERPAKFNLIVNAKTIRALGLTVPDSVMVRADEVIRESVLTLPDWGRAAL